jgi:pyruvate/2-oxoglutarate dehydrogenase complex dihydrolipoamide dehydrogenase (E3) component
VAISSIRMKLSSLDDPIFMKFDLIVIGGGSAGHSAARTAASLKLRCALVQPPGPLGGLCILRGCMPSKTLIETANRLRAIRDASRFGIDASAPSLNLPKLRARLEYLLKDFREYREGEMERSGYELIRGTASFTSPHEITLAEDGRQLTATAFVIATGSKPAIPEIDGLEQTPYWTSDDLVKLPEIPPDVVILGAGAIGMEAAHLLEGFGAKVTIVARGERVLSQMDPTISDAIAAESTDRDIKLLTKTEIASVSHRDGKFHLTTKDGSEMTTSALLVATGRTPETIGYGFQKIGIAMDRKRILIDDRCSTSLHHIFAAGDCASPVPVVHLAVIQGEVAARNAERVIRDGHSELSAEWSPETAMVGLFTEPQCVEIGMNETTAGEKDIAIITGRSDYNDQGKGMIAGSRHGFVKIIADASSRIIIGATGAGPDVIETSHVVQLAISKGLTLEEYASVPHYHPTLAEAWSSAAQAAIDDHPAS